MTRTCLEYTAVARYQLLATLPNHHVFPQSILQGARLTLIDLARVSRLLADGEADRHLALLLTPQEQQLFAGFSLSKRRVEWLGGRLAAKYALGQLLGEGALLPLNTVAVLPDVNGKPVLMSSGAHLGGAGVSLSHSGAYAAALACKKGLCGVDIQCCSDRLERVQERFAPDAERALLAEEHDPVTRLAILWTVKEAMKKCFLADDPTFFGKLRVVGARKRDRTWWVVQCRIEKAGTADATCHVLLFDQYSLACVRGGKNA